MGYGFESVVTGTQKVENGTGYIVHTKFMYAEDDPDAPEQRANIFTWEPTVGTLRYNGATLEYDYIVEVDYSGRITGGEWLGASKRNHPDMFWMPTNKIKFTEEFKILNKIYVPTFVE